MLHVPHCPSLVRHVDALLHSGRDLDKQWVGRDIPSGVLSRKVDAVHLPLVIIGAPAPNYVIPVEVSQRDVQRSILKSKLKSDF